MENQLVILLKDGHIQSVLSNFPCDFQCLLVSANDKGDSKIHGEPWVRPVAFAEGGALQAVLEPMPIQLDPEKVNRILALEKLSRDELLKLLS